VLAVARGPHAGLARSSQFVRRAADADVRALPADALTRTATWEAFFADRSRMQLAKQPLRELASSHDRASLVRVAVTGTGKMGRGFAAALSSAYEVVFR
jgi:hypothetical protein